ncbi:MAG: RDD family protein [Patulibacter minatonensis]
MTQPPEQPPSIYTRLDGTPLAPTQPARPPALGGLPGAPPTSWGQLPAGQQPRTPQVAAGQHFVLATWGSRFGAYLIDALLFSSLAWLIVLPFGIGFGLTVNEAFGYFAYVLPLPESIADPTPFSVLRVAQMLVPGIALAITLVRMQGQTPGKRALGLRVVRADGKPIDTVTAFRRELLAKTIIVPVVAVVTFLLAWVANYLWPVWDREHRAGHDFIAGTRVVQTPRDGAPTTKVTFTK